ncbi:hypothetical protein CMUS01_06914 [Colletotrichum musicola]|uniref:NACHT domain-containing protein n=1 Tax=Colletotrichum musicola TaxID=2175873 RepID=A0A8H6KIX9_9PEZI|nr:hypothetical protein CMUS01_06914 [Colletotrichum musicola]
MYDPLSAAGSVVGIISLGLQVTQSLYNYYNAFRSQQSDTSHTLKKIKNLQGLLDQLLSQIQTAERKSRVGLQLAQDIADIVQECEELIQELKEEADNTLLKLEEDIDGLVDHVSLALSILQQKSINKLQDDTEYTRDVVDLVRASQISDQIQNWLRAPDASIDFNNNYRKRQAGTGLWLVQSPIFKTWLDQPGSCLWLRGFAGCGKSVLCSTAIQDTLRRRGFDREPRVGIAFFFFTFNDETKQDTSSMLRALLLQLSGQLEKPDPKLGKSPSELEKLYKNYKRATPPDRSLLECLHQTCTSFQHVYILLDALDESPRDIHRVAMLEALAVMTGWSHCNLHLLVTSRDEVDIREELEAIQVEVISLKNDEVAQDISLYVSRHLRDDRRLRKWSSSFDEIERVLAQKAQGV